MKKKFVPERRGYVTHYFYDARLAVPSDVRGYAKSEDTARSACVVKIDAERFNKAVIINRDTKEILHVYRRDRETGNIERQDHHYRILLGEARRYLEE